MAVSLSDVVPHMLTTISEPAHFCKSHSLSGVLALKTSPEAADRKLSPSSGLTMLCRFLDSVLGKTKQLSQ